jgi:hypothetical protein
MRILYVGGKSATAHAFVSKLVLSSLVERIFLVPGPNVQWPPCVRH